MDTVFEVLQPAGALLLGLLVRLLLFVVVLAAVAVPIAALHAAWTGIRRQRRRRLGTGSPAI